jgi:two-component system, NtrC family, sensor kinase
LSLLAEELEDRRRPEKISAYLGIADQEIERIASIVHRMREFYRPLSYKAAQNSESFDGFYHLTEEELQAVDLHLILESVLQLANKKLQHNGVQVERLWARKLPHVQGSPDHLKQVFLNLALNALDAMPAEGGRLRIRTTLERMPLSGDLSEGAVRIEFSDTGAGMPPEVLHHIFEPMFSTKEHGSGFGLFTSYQIITAHHGHISAASREGEGTTFSILLPTAQPVTP